MLMLLSKKNFNFHYEFLSFFFLMQIFIQLYNTAHKFSNTLNFFFLTRSDYKKKVKVKNFLKFFFYLLIFTIDTM